MLLRMGAAFQIDNPRGYPAGVVEELHRLLAEGVLAQPDPNRRDFYDIQADDRVFFICIFSVSGAVTLLATWKCTALNSGNDVQLQNLSAA